METILFGRIIGKDKRLVTVAVEVPSAETFRRLIANIIGCGGGAFKLGIGKSFKAPSDKHCKKSGNTVAKTKIVQTPVILTALTVDVGGDMMFELRDHDGLCYVFKIRNIKEKVWFMGCSLQEDV